MVASRYVIKFKSWHSSFERKQILEQCCGAGQIHLVARKHVEMSDFEVAHSLAGCLPEVQCAQSVKYTTADSVVPRKLHGVLERGMLDNILSLEHLQKM